MDGLAAWGGSRIEGLKKVVPHLQRFAIYIFLISFAGVYYLSNASNMLGHYDLGWHLAAGDLIRDRGNIPFQDPWSFTLGDRQWYNLSWLWDVIASVVFQYTNFAGLTLFVVACGAVIVAYLSRLPQPRSLGNCRLYFRFPGVFALPLFCDASEYLYRRFAEHRDHVVLRNFLRRML